MESKHNFGTRGGIFSICQLLRLSPLCLLALGIDIVVCFLPTGRQECKKHLKAQRGFFCRDSSNFNEEGEVFEMGQFPEDCYWQLA